MCGFQVRSSEADKKSGNNVKKKTEVLKRINTRGCIETIEVKSLNFSSSCVYNSVRFQRLILRNLYTVGGIAIGIALSQLLVIWLARTLERQIKSQKALWSLN